MLRLFEALISFKLFDFVMNFVAGFMLVFLASGSRARTNRNHVSSYLLYTAIMFLAHVFSFSFLTWFQNVWAADRRRNRDQRERGDVERDQESERAADPEASRGFAAGTYTSRVRLS